MTRDARLAALASLIGLVVVVGAAATPGSPAPAPVAEAAMHGDVNAVRALIKQGKSVNTAQGDGMTALHWAADRGDSALAAVLLAAHANTAATTRIGNYTPLHIASRSGSAAVVRALIKAGANVKATTMSGATALHLAAAAGNSDVVTALLDAGADPNAKEAQWGQTPLVFAAEYDRANAIRVLLKHGADPSLHTRVENIHDETAKEQAAAKKRNQVLISFEPDKHKADSTKIKAAAAEAAAQQAGSANDPAALNGTGAGARGARGGRGPAGPKPVGPFTAAQIQQAIDSGRTLFAKSDVPTGPVTEEVDTLNGGVAGYANSVGGIGGLTALHHAVRQGNVAAALALLDGGANINDQGEVDHTTPLLMATINGQFDVAMKLIERGADPNIPSTAGMTPLYATINTEWAPKSRFPQPQAIQVQKTSYLDVVKALLDKGANPNVRLTSQPWYFAYNNCGSGNCGLENIEGTTAFWRAAYALDVDAMKLLVAHGADPNVPSQRMAQATAGRGARGGRGGAGGAAGGARGGRGGAPQPPLDPAIDSAAKAAPVGVGVYAIHAAAGVGYGNGFAGNSHRHVPDGWMAAMKYLVEDLHMDVNARDQQGMTPLHHAAARGDNEMILYLVAHGADPKAVSRTGRTTVDMANGPVQRLRPFPETIALLEKLGAKNQHRCVSC